MALQLRNDQNILDDIFRRANVRVIHQFVVQPPTHFRTWSTCRSRREKQKENKENGWKWNPSVGNQRKNERQIHRTFCAMINKSVDCWFVVVPGFSLSICADEAEMRKELDNNIKQQQQKNEYQATGQPVQGLQSMRLLIKMRWMSKSFHLQWRYNWAKVEPLRRKGRWLTKLGDCPQ